MGLENCTVFVGNLSDKVTEEILYELFLQAGPVESVKIPSMQGKQRSFGFVEFKHECSVPYAIQLMENISLYGRNLKIDARQNNLNPHQYQQQIPGYGAPSLPSHMYPQAKYGNGNMANAKDRLGPLPSKNFDNPLRGMNGIKRPHDAQMQPQRNSKSHKFKDQQGSYQKAEDSRVSQFPDFNLRLGSNYPSQGKFDNSYDTQSTKHHHEKKRENDYHHKHSRFPKNTPKHQNDRHEKQKNKFGKFKDSRGSRNDKFDDPFFMKPYNF